MAAHKMFQEAMKAIQLGQRARARDLFTRLLRSDSGNIEYWLWMSTLVESVAERVYCLESALKIDPNNEAARRGLLLLSNRKAGSEVVPVPPIHRNWEKELERELEPPQPFLKRVWNNPLMRLLTILVAGGLLVGLVLASIYGIRRQQEQVAAVIRVSPFPTRTVLATKTPTPTRTLVVRSPTPTFMGPTPLWMFLTETYTPVPLYVNTPHPIVEAYRLGLRAFGRGDWTRMADYMSQSIQTDPGSADLYYYYGIARKMLGEYEAAIQAFDEAISLNPRFAPAYLNRAQSRLGLDPEADIESDLQAAIDADPYFIDSYLERAALRLRQSDPQTALDDLIVVESLFPDSAMMFVLTAQVHLQLGDPVTALQLALQGYEHDRTLLPAYLTLAQAYLANKDYQNALYYGDIYLRYTMDQPEGWVMRGQTLYMLGQDLPGALYALDQAVSLDEESADGWRYRGLVHLALGDARAAVNDLVTAVNLNMLSFDTSIDLAKALWADERLAQAARQFNSAEALAQDDNQRAAVYFWRAQLYEADNKLLDAKRDWGALLELPAEAMPADWRALAEEHWLTLNPPTATQTATRTPIPSPTRTPSPTPSPTITRTPTVTRTPTITPTRTRTITPSPMP